MTELWRLDMTEATTASGFVVPPAEHQFSPMVAVPATGPGALAGFEAVCSCGFVSGSSLRVLAEAGVTAHFDWVRRNR